MVLVRLLLLLFASVSVANELVIVTPESYYHENPSKERRIILDFITNQFKNKSISQQELDLLWNDKEINEGQHLIRFQIINQQLYAGDADILKLFSLDLIYFFKKILKQYKVNDLDLIIYGRDEIDPSIGTNKKLYNIPSFMLSKNLQAEYEKDKFLLPDSFLMREYWAHLTTRILQANAKFLWENKEKKIFWRGATTGWDRKKPYLHKNYNIQNLENIPRLNLVLYSKLYPDLIDAEFVFYNQITPNKDGSSLKTLLHIISGNKHKFAAFTDEKDHLKYKYLISLDGNTCAWSRVPWIMLSNSVLMKQETDNIEWFYSALKPYVHYIPVDERLLELFSKLDWMKHNDVQIKEISKNAQKFVLNNLMPEDIEKQTVIILNEYSKIQQNKKINKTLEPTREEDFLTLFRRLIKGIEIKML